MKKIFVKTLSSVLCAAVLSTQLSMFSATASGNKYEAEKGQLSGSYEIVSDNKASGSAEVVFGRSFTWKQTVTVSKSGYYDLNFYTCGTGGNKINSVYVNDKKTGDLNSAGGNSFSKSSVTFVYLNAGNNTIKITPSWGYFSFDYFTIDESTFDDSVYNVEKTLINENANDSTKKVMSFLVDNYGSKVITGQYCDGGLNGTEFNAIQSATGEKPAMLGLDFMRYTTDRIAHGDSPDAVEKALEFDKAGGIVTFCWHWNVPDEYLVENDVDGNPSWWGGFYTKNVNTSKFNLSTIMNGGNPTAYNALMEDIDTIAAQLQILEDADVPVLFRPLHEASGAWFWWGSFGADAYKKLWKTLYTKLTDEYHLDNLIWVWNGQAADWYPGDEYVDIIGEDIYPGQKVYSPQSSKFTQATNYTDGTKLVAMSENGCLFDLEAAKEAHTIWSYFGTWSGEFCISGGESYNEKSVWQKVYNSDLAVNLDDLPDLKNYPLDGKSVSSLDIQTVSSVEYTGNKITPLVTIKDNGTLLTEGTDYTLEYSNNVDIGTATIKIKGAGSYTGVTTRTFTITAKQGTAANDIVNATITNISSQTFLGEEIKPIITVRLGGKLLLKGRDYTVSYTDNVNIGTATATITAKGNYTGTVKKTFEIIVRKSTTLSTPMIIGRQTTPYTAVFTWVPNFTVNGYEVMYADNSAFTNSKTTEVNGYGVNFCAIENVKYDSVNGYNPAKNLYAKVRAFYYSNGKKVYSSWSASRYLTPKS